MKNKALIIYNGIDAIKNQWFINHLIDCLDKEDVVSKFITSQGLYKSLDNSEDINKLDFIPDLVINRSRNYHLSEIFERNNIRAFNSSQITKIANDKDNTYQYFLGKVDFLPYKIFKTDELFKSNYQTIHEMADDFGYPFVLKVAEGHGGDCVFLINNQEQLLSALNEIKNKLLINKCPYKKAILQKVSKTLGKDLRVYVLGGRIISAIMRSSNEDFRSNYSLGGNTYVHNLTTKELEITEKIIGCLPADLYGIDFVYDNDVPILNEIEDAVGTRMLYQNTNIDIVKEYAKYIAENKKKS